MVKTAPKAASVKNALATRKPNSDYVSNKATGFRNLMKYRTSEACKKAVHGWGSPGGGVVDPLLIYTGGPQGFISGGTQAILLCIYLCTYIYIHVHMHLVYICVHVPFHTISSMLLAGPLP